MAEGQFEPSPASREGGQKTGVAIERLASEIPFIGLLLKKETDVQQLLTMKDTTGGLKM